LNRGLRTIDIGIKRTGSFSKATGAFLVRAQTEMVELNPEKAMLAKMNEKMMRKAMQPSKI
jgi:hypothetical protein